MKKYAIYMTFVLSIIFIFITVGATQEKEPFLRNKPKTIDSLSDDYNKGVEIEIRKGSTSDTLKVIRYISSGSSFPGLTVEGGTMALTKEILKDNYVNFDAEKIKIAPSIIVPISSTESISSGSKGAKLKRIKDKGILLIGGTAYLIRK